MLADSTLSCISAIWSSFAHATTFPLPVPAPQDEPTNHLDTTNVAWLEDWLVAQDKVTTMTVSHDR
jgi:hypothetical protein